MSIATDIRSYLLTQSALTTTASTRISVQKRDQGTALPCIVLHSIDSQHGTHLRGASGWSRARVQVDSLAGTYLSAASIDELVRGELHSLFNVTIGSTSRLIGGVELDGRRDLYDDPIDASDVGTYGVSSDYLVMHRESIPTLST